MEPFRVTQNLGYGICLNSCYCNVFKKRHETIIKNGCLAKFQYRNWNRNRSVLTLVTKKSEVFVPEILSYNLIEFKLFKYLNAIIDFDERLKFYKNVKQREFVLYLEKNSLVSVGFSSGKQTKAVFLEINENEEKIFITVELLERPFKYSLPANMVHKIASLDSSRNNNRLFSCCMPTFRPNFDYSTLAYWRCYDNVQNHNTSNVSRGKSVSKSVEPVKKKIISQNSGGSKNKMKDNPYKPASNNEPRNDFSRKTVERNAKRDGNRFEPRVGSALIVPSSFPTVCYVCSEVCEGKICRSCDNQAKSSFGQNNFQTNNGLNIPVVTRLSNYKPIKWMVCPECSNVCEGNNCHTCDTQTKNNFVQDNSKTNVVSNISSVTSLFDHKPIKSRVCLKCSKEYEGNICRNCDNGTKNNFSQDNSKTNVTLNISAIKILSSHTTIKSNVCSVCSNECEGNICRTCDNQTKNNFSQDNSKTNVVPNISTVTSLLNHKQINSNVCSECSNVCEGNICRTCDNEVKKSFGQNNSQSKYDSNISLDPSLFTHKLINLQANKICGLCSNVCEGNICLSCVNETKNMFGQTNSKINFDSNISSDTSLSTDIPTNWDVCVECLQAAYLYEGNICFNCDLKKISGQNNFQTKDKSLSNEKPITPLEINDRHVTNEDYLPDNSKVAVRHNIFASNCIICNKHLNVSDGFFLMLCQHTFCELCIKNQINLKMLAHTNILPCCDRPIEQDEIKYFLYKHEYEQFKQSETSVGPALFVSSNSSTDISINSAVSVPGSNVCESINCDDNKEKIVKENNSEAKDTSVPTDILINSKVCLDCLNVYEGNICPKCDLEKISAQNNPLINVDSNISSYSSLTSETSINSFEINHGINNWETNENDLSDNSNMAVIHNISASNCIICKKDFDISEGFFFDLCKHTICKICIKNQTALKKLAHINIMPCCDRPIELDEKKYFSDIQQCFDKNCSAYYLWDEGGEEGLIMFNCNKCKLDNCLKCEAIHVNLTCEQYDKITGEGNSVDKETAEMFLTWIREGIAMPCPKCEALIEKDEGCDWVQCPFCDVEICWATRGPRWGPNGKGDTSGGCGCDFKVKKCVENCNYCH